MVIFCERNFSLKSLIYQCTGMRHDLTLFWHGGSPSLQWGVSDAACQVLVIVNWAGTVVKWANCREWSTKFTKCTPTVTGGGSLNYYLTPPIFPGNRSLRVQEKMSMHKLQKYCWSCFSLGIVEMTKYQTAYFCCFYGCWMMVHVGWIIEMTETLKRIHFSQDVDVGCWSKLDWLINDKNI